VLNFSNSPAVLRRFPFFGAGYNFRVPVIGVPVQNNFLLLKAVLFYLKMLLRFRIATV
jgi:phosphoribosylcarboxyaminoimidazole (NCAIR) mutase